MISKCIIENSLNNATMKAILDDTDMVFKSIYYAIKVGNLLQSKID